MLREPWWICLSCSDRTPDTLHCDLHIPLILSPQPPIPLPHPSYVGTLNPTDPKTEVVVAPPAIYLLQVQSHLSAPAQVSAQNCFTESSGAFTGEISPNQLKDAEVHWVILGHSERRSLFGEADKVVADKVRAAVGAGLKVIACIGEKLEEREGDKTMEVVERQLAAIKGEVKEENWK